jgi:hypothetical protein
MFGYVLLAGFLYTIYRNMTHIKSCGKMYIGYKNIIDPENKLSHFSTVRSIVNMFWKPVPKEDPPLEKFNKKYLKISYKYKDKNYFYLLKIPKGVTPIQTIQDESGNDIDDILSPYLGPNLDCHGASISPIDFGYSKVVITTIFDKVVTFEENDNISLTL